MTGPTSVPILPTGTYRHNKSNKLYEVIGVAKQTESDSFVVIYKPLYEHELGFEFFTRPFEMFTDTVEINGNHVARFEKVDD